jgi:hypothetical protein
MGRETTGKEPWGSLTASDGKRWSSGAFHLNMEGLGAPPFESYYVGHCQRASVTSGALGARYGRWASCALTAGARASPSGAACLR